MTGVVISWAPNVDKETIALNLKEALGQRVLHDIVRTLQPDVFCCNTLPGRYQQLGVDFEILSTIKKI